MKKSRSSGWVRHRWKGGLLSLAGLALLAASLGCGGVERPDVPRVDDPATLDPKAAELLGKMIGEVEADAGNPGKWVLLAMAYHANDLFPQARDCYRTAVDMDGDQPRWWYQLAKVNHEIGDRPAAFQAMARVIELEDGYPPAFWRRGEWHLEEGQPELAEPDFRRALELDGEDPEALLGLARTHLELGRPEEAAALMERLVILDPEDPQAHQLLATAYRQLNRPDDVATHLALAEGNHFVRTDSWATDILRFQVGYADRLALAQRYESDGQWDAAMSIYGKLLEDWPDDLRVQTQLGRVLILTDRVAEAGPLLRRAVAQHPESAEARFELAGYLLKSGDPAAALTEIDRAVELNPSLATVHQRRGLILKAQERCDAAVPSFLKALELSPDEPKILIPLGDCQGSLGNWQQAGAAYRAALAKESEDADLHVRFGFSLLRLGQLRAAEQALTRAMELGPRRPHEVGRLLQRVRGELKEGGAGDAG